jgi:predicted phage baseplate assembly protein
MTLPRIELDDRRFQELVTEARDRIAKRCPNWTDHNVSDPGITLIELFAWMTEMTIYRLNRVPEKLHVELLELLGTQLDPPAAARTDIRFRLAVPPVDPVPIPAVETEVATVRTLSTAPVVFQVSESFTIPVARPVAYAVERRGRLTSVTVNHGVAEPSPGDQPPFDTPPRAGDALYIGFDAPLSRLTVQISVQCAPAPYGQGVDPDNPPLDWYASDGAGGWLPADVLFDSTGGFNRGSGTIEVEVPSSAGQGAIGGTTAHWLRCTVRPREPALGSWYSESPRIFSLTAAPIGALLPAHHAVAMGELELGASDGTPAQTFRLPEAPVLPLAGEERLEVRVPDETTWEAWQPCLDFAESGPDDPHFVLDAAAGEVRLGPAVRHPAGGWRQHGAVPPKGAVLRLTGRRQGGGVAGNVAQGELQVLRSAIPGVARVTNPRSAHGGADAETLENARTRTAIEYRSRERAVTARDYEILAERVSPDRIARTRCVPARRAGDVARLYVLPTAPAPARRLSAEELSVSDAVLHDVRGYLDERRPIGASIDVLPATIRELIVVLQVNAAPNTSRTRVEQDILEALNVFINPLVGGVHGGLGPGWAWERPLVQGELYAIVHAVPGVASVRLLHLYEPNSETGELGSAIDRIAPGPGELLTSGEHQIRVSQPR